MGLCIIVVNAEQGRFSDYFYAFSKVLFNLALSNIEIESFYLLTLRLSMLINFEIEFTFNNPDRFLSFYRSFEYYFFIYPPCEIMVFEFFLS